MVASTGAAKRSGAPAGAGQGPECAARVNCTRIPRLKDRDPGLLDDEAVKSEHAAGVAV